MVFSLIESDGQKTQEKGGKVSGEQAEFGRPVAHCIQMDVSADCDYTGVRCYRILMQLFFGEAGLHIYR